MSLSTSDAIALYRAEKARRVGGERQSETQTILADVRSMLFGTHAVVLWRDGPDSLAWRPVSAYEDRALREWEIHHLLELVGTAEIAVVDVCIRVRLPHASLVRWVQVFARSFHEDGWPEYLGWLEKHNAVCHDTDASGAKLPTAFAVRDLRATWLFMRFVATAEEAHRDFAGDRLGPQVVASSLSGEDAPYSYYPFSRMERGDWFDVGGVHTWQIANTVKQYAKKHPAKRFTVAPDYEAKRVRVERIV